MSNDLSFYLKCCEVCAGLGKFDLTDRPNIFEVLTQSALIVPAQELLRAQQRLNSFLDSEVGRYREYGVDAVYSARYHARVQGIRDLIAARLVQAEQQIDRPELTKVQLKVLAAMDSDFELTVNQIVSIANWQAELSAEQVSDVLDSLVALKLIRHTERGGYRTYDRLRQPAGA